MKMTTSCWGLSILATLALTQVASALAINYQVTKFDSLSPESTLFGPNLHPAGTETWNMDQWLALSPAATDMLDVNGVATGVEITCDGLEGPDRWGEGVELTLLHRVARRFDNDSYVNSAGSFSIKGLTPGAEYDLYIASTHIGTKTVGDWTTSNVNKTGPAVVINNTGNENNGSTWVAGANYVLFKNVVANRSGEITMTSHLTEFNGSRVGFNGFQLISSVPEPSVALLGAFGLLACLRRRRA